jgi:hypothetical protein
MWLLAETENQTAINQFIGRYPEFADEMRKREKMVGGLKRARSTQPAIDVNVPKFRTKRMESPAPTKWNPVAVAVTGVMVLGAVAAASFFAVMNSPKAVPIVQSNDANPKFTTFRTSEPTQNPVIENPNLGLKPEPGPHDEPPLRPATPKYLEPTSFSVRGAKLVDAIRMVGTGADLEVVVAPGFPDVSVDVSYSGLNTIQILQSMGLDYGFTAFDQGDGSVLVVPARDPALESPTKSRIPLTAATKERIGPE